MCIAHPLGHITSFWNNTGVPRAESKVGEAKVTWAPENC